MATAYVLLNTEIGSEKAVLKTLKALDGVEEAYQLWGVYDIIVNVSAKNMEELKHIITHDFDSISEISSKLTMITSEKAPLAFGAAKDGPEHGVIDREPMSVYA